MTFSDSETTLHDMVKVETCHYTFFQTHMMYNKSGFSCKRWAWSDPDVTVWVHYRRCTTLAGVWIMGEPVCVGRGAEGEFP